ncbi:MAG: TPM domain-containing protein [Paracoccaceae bacterium]|nr:TPM domain-containing protein [Paracoccaceae bacterium]
MRLHLIFAALFFLLGHAALAQNYPSRSDRYVNDHAGLLSTEQADTLRKTLRELEQARNIEFTVVTIDQMSDYGHSGPIEPFATGLFNRWGIGDARRNDGLMLLVSRYDRELRVEVGSGYGSSQNAAAKEIIDDVIVPYFKRDDYAGGIRQGVSEMIRSITGRWPGEYDASLPYRVGGWLQRALDTVGDWAFLALAPLGFVGYQVGKRWHRTRPRYCPVDGNRMVRTDEKGEDPFLKPGQITEERVGSVDYDVWRCQNCGHVKIEAYKAMFNSFGACNSCGYRTLHGETTVLASATYHSTGRERVDYHCQNCDDRRQVFRVIPARTRDNNSSSGGGSSGGGSSSGGGASGSW